MYSSKLHRMACVLPLVAASHALAVDLSLLTLPEGYTISVYAEGVENARQMALGDQGTIFVGSRRAGKVHAVVDRDGDHRADQVFLIDEGLKMPSGVAFRDGSLYVAAVGDLYRYDRIESRLEDPPERVLVTDHFPDDEWHGWKHIEFGPDGKLYVPIGAPCNVCLRDGYARIVRIQPDGSGEEVVAEGVRNSVGFDFDPKTGDLWFTDNGRDMLGDNLPPCELNHVTEPGQHFGFPFWHAGLVRDPEFGGLREFDEFVPPAQQLMAHVAPLGMIFYRGSMFEDLKNDILVAEHGSWNRSHKSGYRVMRAFLNEQREVVKYAPFITGWLDGEQSWGRPVDLLELPDGSILISDDQAGVLYRVSHSD
ncbi:MAG: sorbosone dehydrogenase family protein [Wenzhouxiangellaceae bacterium]